MGGLSDAMDFFICLENRGSMTEINFWFPCVFGRGVTFPCGQVLLSARRALVGDNVINLVFFFRVNHVRRRPREGWTMCFSLTIRR